MLNKVDGVSRVAVMRQLQALAEWGFEEYFAVSRARAQALTTW